MKNANFFIILLLVAICLQAKSEETVTAADTVEELNERILKILAESGVPGMIGVIVYGDEVIWQGAHGIADKASNRQVTEDTLFQVAFISKSFVSLSILKLDPVTRVR